VSPWFSPVVDKKAQKGQIVHPFCAFAFSLRLCVKFIFHANPQRKTQRRKEGKD
jgi:hypothetical protein